VRLTRESGATSVGEKAPHSASRTSTSRLQADVEATNPSDVQDGRIIGVHNTAFAWERGSTGE